MISPFKGLLAGTPALAPLRDPIYRGLWLAWGVANLTMWSHDVAAAWLMTSLTDSTVMVALVQTASTLPVFLLGVPSGAMADIVDRRRYFAATQLWVAVTATLLAVLAASGALNAQLLLVLTFVNGIGLAMRWPVFSAIVPEVVPRSRLTAALALGGISMNLSRVIGPVVAGALIASVGTSAVFALNAVMSAIGIWLILRWRSQPATSALPGERFLGAMRVGLQHVKESPTMRIVVLRVFLFFLHTSALLALMPLVARGLDGGSGAGMFTAMMSFLGGGAVLAALQFTRWRERHDRDSFVKVGTIAHALVSTLIVAVPTAWVALPGMALIGAAWISVANSLNVAAQMALPNWVRARGMSIYQMALMGGTALGAGLWGQVADLSSVPAAVIAAALAGVLVLFALRRWKVEGGADEDLTPLPPVTPNGLAELVGPQEGPVMVVVEYLIDPARAAEFAVVMRATRSARLRQGALSWGLFRDAAVSGRYVESFVDENWIEHLRRLERFTAADHGLRAQRLAFHLGDGPPRVQRFVAEPLAAGPTATP